MILTSGAFDGLHAGHVQYLEAAKALCEQDELLVCAIAPDSYIVQSKGRAPYWHQADRLRTVTALGCIDAAIPQVRQSVAELITEHRPRLFIKGPDWEGRLPEDIQQACERVGTSIGYVDTPGTHVSETRISDEEALARFEELVLSQQPATVPWTPVTDYSFEARKVIEGKHPELIKAVFEEACVPRSRPIKMLDAGCGPDAHLVELLKWSGVDIEGIDVQAGEHRWTRKADITDPNIFDGEYGDLTEGNYDVVISREVLEHLPLTDIRYAVSNLCRASRRFVYITTRFCKSPAHLLSVDTSDDLDPTHISCTNQAWLRHLFVLEGFRRRADLESRLDWQNKKRVLVYERA